MLMHFSCRFYRQKFYVYMLIVFILSLKLLFFWAYLVFLIVSKENPLIILYFIISFDKIKFHEKIWEFTCKDQPVYLRKKMTQKKCKTMVNS